jgi:gluconolactonase
MTTTVHEPLQLTVLGDDLGFTEGPVVMDDGTVYAVDVVATPGGGPNGLALDSPTSVLVANNGGFVFTEVNGRRIPFDFAAHTNEPPGFTGGWIERVDLVTGAVEVLQTECNGRALRGPNDLVVDEVGGAWFTDHGKGRLESIDRGGLYYLPPEGSVVQQVFPLLGPNGVGLSPDNRRVYVAETFTGRLWAWDLAAPGELASPAGECVVATPSSFDSLAIEADGRIAIGGIREGIVVVTPDGSEIDVYPIPDDITTNIAFGGADMRRAVITLSRSGRVVETTWPRPGHRLNVAG